MGNSRYAYVFCDGVNVRVRLGEDPKVCFLVVIGVNQDGTKELLAVEEGYRESKESWASVLRDLKRRCIAEPLMSVADGSREAALTMAFKLLTEVEKRWRRINGAHLVVKVLEGVRFKDGIEQTEVPTEEKVVA